MQVPDHVATQNILENNSESARLSASLINNATGYLHYNLYDRTKGEQSMERLIATIIYKQQKGKQ